MNQAGRSKIRYWGRILLVVAYFGAGINHFVNPEFYIPLIPDYFPNKPLINWLSGVAEVLGAIGVLIPVTRRIAVWGLIAMLLAFIPAHVYFIQLGGCVPGGLCTPMWVAWVRLVVIHPLLIWWAWVTR